MSLKIIEQTIQCVDDLIECSSEELSHWKIWTLGPRVVRLISVDEYYKKGEFCGDRAAEFFCRVYFAKSNEPLSISRIGTYWIDSPCERDGKSVSKGLEVHSYSKCKKSRKEINSQLLELKQNIPLIVHSMFGRQRWTRINSFVSFLWTTYDSSNNLFCELFGKYNCEIVKKWRQYNDYTLYVAKCDDLVELAGELEVIFRCIIVLADKPVREELKYQTEGSTVAFLVPHHLHERLEVILYKD